MVKKAEKDYETMKRYGSTWIEKTYNYIKN